MNEYLHLVIHLNMNVVNSLIDSNSYENTGAYTCAVYLNVKYLIANSNFAYQMAK